MEPTVYYKLPLDIILPIGLVIVILITVIFVLYYKNRQINNLIQNEKQQFGLYLQNVEALKKKSKDFPEKTFKELNKYVREFLKEYLELNYSLTYFQLERKFVSENKADYAKFFQSMAIVDYSGEKDNSEEIRKLVDFFYKILLVYKNNYYQ